MRELSAHKDMTTRRLASPHLPTREPGNDQKLLALRQAASGAHVPWIEHGCSLTDRACSSPHRAPAYSRRARDREEGEEAREQVEAWQECDWPSAGEAAWAQPMLDVMEAAGQ